MRRLKLTGSQNFIFRTKCKFCKSGPSYFYFIFNKNITVDNLYKMKDYYVMDSLRADDVYVATSIKNRSFIVNYMFDFDSTALRKLAAPHMHYKRSSDSFSAVVECHCGKTSWMFVPSSRSHIKNRKVPDLISIKDIRSVNKAFK